MLTFYQWNKTFKILADNFSTLSLEASGLVVSKKDHFLINGYKRKSRKSGKQKTLSQHLRHQEKKTITFEQKEQDKQTEVNPFNNSTIKQKLTTISPGINDEAIRSSLKITKINVNNCGLPIHKYLRNKLKEAAIFTQRKKTKSLDNQKVQSKEKNFNQSVQTNDALEKQMIKAKVDEVRRKSLFYHNSLKNKFSLFPQSQQYSLGKECPESIFFTIQQQIKQSKPISTLIPSRRTSKSEAVDEQISFLRPFTEKRSQLNTKAWYKYRRNTSNYKTQYEQNMSKSFNSHKKSLQSIITYGWQSLGKKLE